MNSQEVFNKVATHLLKQNSRCTDGQETVCEYKDGKVPCRYKNAKGENCAIGVLIKDSVYSTELEDKGCLNRVVVKALEDSGLTSLSTDTSLKFLLADLQSLHDKQPVFIWKTQLNTLAYQYGLTMPSTKKDVQRVNP